MRDVRWTMGPKMEMSERWRLTLGNAKQSGLGGRCLVARDLPGGQDIKVIEFQLE